MHYALYQGVPPHFSVTWRDSKIAFMKSILKEFGKKAMATFPNKDPKACDATMYLVCYELDWIEIDKRLANIKDLFECCSLFHDVMEEDKETEHPYPLKINIKLFGHHGSIYIVSKAQIFNSQEQSLHGIYITTKDSDFPGTELSNKKVPKQKKFNYDAYQDISDILTGEPNNEEHKARQKEIAGYLLDTLDGKIREAPYDMAVIRAMWMAISIPFIAEIAPPPDRGITEIQSVCSRLINGDSLNDVHDNLKGLGGNNPGSHIYCYNLYKGIRSGNNTFKNVLLYPYQKHNSTLKCPVKDCNGHIKTSERKGPDPEYTCSLQRRGVLQYRINMFSNRDEVLLACASQAKEVIIN